MKKVIAFIMALMLIMTMVIPVYAIELPEIKIDFKLPDSFWDKWFKDHPIKLPDGFWGNWSEPPDSTEPTEATEVVEITELATPTITTAKYVHQTPYYGMKRHLEISWNVVEGAESYEVLITKADGTTIDYTVTDNMIYDTSAECPRVYIEVERLWASASVQVRAVTGNVYSNWSEVEKIGCDMLH